MWKKILGIGLAMAVSLSTSTVPVLAETISIVDDVISEEVTNDENDGDEITDEEAKNLLKNYISAKCNR